MRRRQSVSDKFEKDVSTEKAKLEARLVELNAQLAFLKKARPKEGSAAQIDQAD